MNNNYIVIGDSITYGIGDFENGGWASLLKKYYVNKDDSKVCKNYVHVAGFPGATSTNILNKIEYIFNSFKDEEFKNTVILSIGVNDTQECNGNNKTSIKDYQNNIQKIIDYLVKQGARLIIVGIARIEHDDKFYWKPNKYYSNQEIKEYDNVLRILSRNNHVEYIPMDDVLDKDNFIDGLHPNQKGHKKMFERVKEYLDA